MNSVEKCYRALEYIADLDDEELDDALPIPLPPAMARGFLPIVARNMPDNPHVLDQFLTDVGNFCHDLRSDHEPATAA